jgi:hypothetical protein
LPAAPANAQTAIRTYVSVSGSDSNPCSLTAPCRHFQAAVNATSAGGEVDALENNSGAGMDFNPSGTMNVTLSDSVIADNGIDGVAFYANGPAAKIMVRNSTIANNTDIGVTTAGGTAQIWLTRSTITGNGTGWYGTVYSYEDNNIDGDTNTDTAPPAIGYK